MAWLSVCLWLRLWSWGPGIKFRIGLPAGSLLLPLPVSLPLSLSVSHELKKQNKRMRTITMTKDSKMDMLKELMRRYNIPGKEIR